MEPDCRRGAGARDALVVVDVQNDFLPGGPWPAHCVAGAPGDGERALESMRKAGARLMRSA
ncbi:MAG: hypothetical protein WA373_08460 [Burkholderiales bacterium]